MKAFLIRTPSGFKPAFDSDYEVLKKVKYNDPIEVTWKQPRNYQNHKRYWAMLACTIDNMSEDIPDRYQNTEYLRKELMIATGYCDWRESLSGKEYPIAQSMSFGSMDENKFQEVYRNHANYLLKYFLKDWDYDMFEENMNLYM